MKKISLVLVIIALVSFSCKKQSSNVEVESDTLPPSQNNNQAELPCDSTCWIRLDFDGDLNDTSCNNMNVQAVNTTFVTDKNGNSSKAIAFTGHDGSNVTIAGASYTRPQFPFTVSFWMNPLDSSTSYFSIGSQDYNTGAGFSIGINNRGKMQAGFSDGTAPGYKGIISNDEVRSGLWSHITAVYNTNGQINIYINGSLSNGTTLGTSTVISYGNADGFYIGKIAGITSPTDTGIKIDKVKIWKKALTVNEILNEYNQ